MGKASRKSLLLRSVRHRPDFRQSAYDFRVFAAIQIGSQRRFRTCLPELATHPQHLRQQPVWLVPVRRRLDGSAQGLLSMRKIVLPTIEKREIEPGVLRLLGIARGANRGDHSLAPSGHGVSAVLRTLGSAGHGTGI